MAGDKGRPSDDRDRPICDIKGPELIAPRPTELARRLVLTSTGLASTRAIGAVAKANCSDDCSSPFLADLGAIVATKKLLISEQPSSCQYRQRYSAELRTNTGGIRIRRNACSFGCHQANPIDPAHNGSGAVRASYRSEVGGPAYRLARDNRNARVTASLRAMNHKLAAPGTRIADAVHLIARHVSDICQVQAHTQD